MGAYSIVDSELSECRSNRRGNPMWNFGLPYTLKHLIDLVAQRNYPFAYDGKQYGPPLEGGEGSHRLYTRFTFPARNSHTAFATRSPGNLSLLLVTACRCSRSSERNC